MGTFDVKKLGQSLIDTSKTSIPNTNKQKIFKSPTIGSGEDDRNLEENENSFMTLSKINKSLSQKKLLMKLESDYVGVPEKLERIRMASTMEDTLPNFSTFSSTVSSPSLLAGNLADEWDF